MDTHSLTLIQKTNLTHDVYELIYTSPKDLEDQPGQFFLCDCDADDTTKKRAYSIAWSYPSHTNHTGDTHEYGFVIKRLEDGTGGSKAICDQEVGHTMEISGPLGHFTLRSSQGPKLFIGTGTGFAPLWYQLRHILSEGNTSPITFIFGVRHKQDVFYMSRLSALQEMHPNLHVEYCLSQDSVGGFYKGYVTDFITSDNLKAYNIHAGERTTGEVSICGSPAMVRDAREKLFELGVKESEVKYEQY